MHVLLLLLCCCLGIRGSAAARGKHHGPAIVSPMFQFTAPLYNMTLMEAVRGRVYSEQGQVIRVGVPVPTPEASIKFKIVEGDRQHSFKAQQHIVGDFAFLRIRHDLLNREVRDSYDFVVKAICRRCDLSNLETTAKVHIRVEDLNDAWPFFAQPSYQTTIDTNTPPFAKILQVNASDADVGLNGELYFSLRDRSLHFHVDPVSGWIRVLNTPPQGSHEIVVKAEDRASRLFSQTPRFPGGITATVIIDVTEAQKPEVRIEAEIGKVQAAEGDQTAAILRISEVPDGLGEMIIANENTPFMLVREKPSRNTWLLRYRGRSRHRNLEVELFGWDVSQIGRNSTKKISIPVERDSKIAFLPSATVYHVNDSVPINYVVAHFIALSTLPEDTVIYTLDSKKSLPFGLNAKTGVLRVTSRLDSSKYKFSIKAKTSDSKAEAVLKIEVVVDRTNRHAPKWIDYQDEKLVLPKDVKNFEIFKVQTEDADKDQVIYKLASEVDPKFEEYFSVNHISGSVSLKKRLPSSSKTWDLPIDVFDNGWPLARTSQIHCHLSLNRTELTITRTPVKEPTVSNKAPIFDPLPKETIQIDEDALVGSVVATVNAHDSDYGYPGLVQYSTADDFFTIDVHTGEITVLSELSAMFDSNTPSKLDYIDYDLTVTASDLAEPPTSTDMSLRIRINDANNHYPIFEKNHYHTVIPENTVPGEKLLTVSATDADYGRNGKVEYRIASVDDRLAIDPDSGVVTVLGQFDREQAPEVTVTLMAIDRGNPPNFAFVNLTVTLSDANDNAPQCHNQNQKFLIPEDWPNGGIVGCVAASDADIGPNAQLRYTLNTPEKAPFTIDPSSGCLFVDAEKTLDFETRAFYNLSIDVRDHGVPSLSTVCHVVVELSDVNENLNPPRFGDSDMVYEVTVNENLPEGTEVLKLNATDVDNANEEIRHSIIGGTGLGLFEIDENGMIRTNSILDREVNDHYWITVSAEDSAVVHLSSVAHVFIRVADQNDHLPHIKEPIYFASIPENSIENTVVVKVEAYDVDDQPKSKNSASLRYSIVKGNPQSHFRVDDNTGYVVTGARKLDRERQSEHELHVQVCDQSTPSLCNTVIVVVNVTDLNDNAPVFPQAVYNVNVPAGVTGQLCRVYASDADVGTNAEIDYSVKTKGFSIDNLGQVSTRKPLKAGDQIALQVTATDRGMFSLATNTTVVLAAVEVPKRKMNRAPELVNIPKEITISDREPVGTTVTLFEATDPDKDELWWNLVNFTEFFALRVDHGGLEVAKPLTFIPANITRIKLGFTVTDGVDTVTGSLQLKLKRSISSRPSFERSHHEVDVSPKIPVGTAFFQVRLTTVTQEEVIYSIHSVDNVAAGERLRIEQTTGNLIAIEPFDAQVSRNFSVVVLARSAGGVNATMVNVDLLDENDSAPKFLKPGYFVSFDSSSALAGTELTTVTAHDPDSGNNGLVKYSIASGNENGLFEIDPVLGIIKLPRKAENFIEALLTIRATDSAEFPLTSTTTVRLIATENPQNATVQFFRNVYQVTVKTSTHFGSVLLVVNAESAATVYYSLNSECAALRVHRASGAVTLAKKLFEKETIGCNVTAKTTSGRKTHAKIVMKVVAGNEHAPSFNSTVYYAYIQENATKGSPVFFENTTSPLIVHAYDNDHGPNGMVNYRIISPNEPYFTVDFVSGAIRSVKPIDFAQHTRWSFYVQASDMGNPARSATVPALVIVSIVGINNIPPRIVAPETNSAVTVHLPTVFGFEVTRIKAVDEDTVGKLRYSMSPSKLFTIDPHYGIVTVIGNNSELAKHADYNLHFIVSDGIQSAHSNLKITVKNATIDRSSLHFSEQTYRIDVIENTTAEGPLFNAQARGILKGETVFYRIANSHPQFLLDSSSGILSLKEGTVLDREETPQLELLIEAKSLKNAGRYCRCVLTVNVVDINDSPPVFLNVPYEAVISQDSKEGEKILSVKAIDADYGMNGVVRYRLGKDAPDFLKINKFDGRITIAKTVPPTAQNARLEFAVEAQDQGDIPLKTQERVVLQFVDRSMPIFSHSKYLARVAENAPTGTVVATVRALSNVGGTVMFVIREGDPQKHFEIGTETGLITVRKNGLIDRESQQEYRITVAAIDVTRPNISATTTVLITVDDVNDNPPRFEQLLYRITVNEATHVGTALTTVTAVDPDEGDSQVAYHIVGPNATVVTVDDAGQIHLARQLDFEEIREYRFVIRASDRDQLASEAWLQITVEDANDHAPFFKEPYIRTILSDDLTTGQFVAHMNADDVDTVTNLPDGARFLYSVIDGDETLFSLDHHTGVVRLARPIEPEDLEFDRVKRLNVSVSDGLFTAYGHLEVTFSISGALWPPPRFRQSVYSASVRENRPITNSSAIAVVEAVGGLPPIQYSMGGVTQPEDRTWPVYVDPDSGRIYARDTLDFEERRVWRLPLVAQDARQRSTFSTLVLNVLDANDNAPEWIAPDTGVQVSAQSGITVGELVAVVMAVDKDENDQVEYSIVADDTKMARYFSIHPRQGLITLRKSLTKVEGEKLSFFVRASDLANPPHQSEMQVAVSVVGNDVEVVRFGMSHYFFTVAEDAETGTVVGWLQIDQNYSNSKVRFSIASPSENLPFSLDSTKGRLIVSQKLDREKMDVFRFVARLTAENKAETVAVVTVRLIDVNDNAPAFQGVYDSLSVTEDAPVGTSIAVFSATDRDQGPNSRIYFSIEENSPDSEVPFRMDRETGWLMVKEELDREQKDKYNLKVLATDEGGLSSKYKVMVAVKDVNDSPPVFEKDLYEVTVDLDSATKGQEILKLKISDQDLPPNDDVRLSLIEGNLHGLFNVTGHRILLSKNPPKRTLKPMNLKLLAFDGKHSTEATVVVKFKNPDQKQCKALKRTLTIREDTPKGTRIAKLQGKGFNITGDDFTVVGEHLVIAKDVDFERIPYYELTLVKSDVGFCVEEYRIHLEDVNDNPPKFGHSKYNATIKENLNSTVYVLRVNAIDAESTVTYSFAEKYDGFEIEPETGAVSATKPLDREVKSDYELLVIAKDTGGLSDEATVSIQVADENDNAPVFEKKEYRIQMLENQTVGFELLRVKAVDVDHHHNVISYSLKEYGNFEIEENTGKITLKKEIDFEVTLEVVFFVVASDNGQPPLSTEARVTVEILDVNDNVPKFHSNEFQAKVDENSPIGTKILQIEATDADSAHYGSVAYRILGDDAQNFEIGPDGQITTRKEFDFELKKTYEFQAEASDGGEPPLRSNSTVKVTVVDLNDNLPVFETCNMTAVIQEGTDPKLPLLQMKISDVDGAGNGAPFRIALSGEGSERFTLDKEFNLFQKAKKLTKKTYRLSATAYDAGNQSTVCPVTVYVKEQSRHPPNVTSMIVTLNTVMGEFLGGKIGTVHAEDPDKGDMLRFSVRPEVEGFRIDPDSGALVAQPDLLAGIYRLNVTVTDGKYTVGAPVIVDVSSIDQDALDHSISVRIKNMNGERFLDTHVAAFHNTVAKQLNVQPTHVRILSLQEISVDHHHNHRLRYRKRRTLDTDLDVLFTVSRGDARGYLRPTHVRQRLEQSAVEISDVTKLEIISLTTEVCRRDLCVKGECRDRLWLESSGDYTEYGTFLSPRHKRTFECICKDGFGGRRCDVAVDRCSREQCAREEMCVATDEEPGFRCVCPPGRKGERCAELTCEGERDCSQTAELSVAGDGYIHMTISTSLERRLELSVEMKTLSSDATIMYARGKSDFHQIRLIDGYAEYRWDCGTGEGVARVPHMRISDGKWHVLKVSRRGRHARLTIDETHSAEGYSAPGSDVLNLYSSGMTLVLGARVVFANEALHDVFSVVPFEHQTATDVAQKVTEGVTACFRRIAIDGLTLPKTRQGIRLHNVNIGCAALDSNPCSSQPCQNEGVCSADPTSVRGFRCDCPVRFAGPTCENDLNACASSPCPNGVQCQNLLNDFLCMCPPGFSGKTCQHRGQWNPCASSPCGPYGQCFPSHFSDSGYECLCSRGYFGVTCSQKIPSFLAHFWPLNIIEIAVFLVVIALFIAIIVLVVCLCRRKANDGQRKVSVELKDDDVRHSLIHAKPQLPSDSPPPLPPRSYRPQFSNFESAQMTGLPTVQVRPLPPHERLSNGRCDSRSPSLADSAHSNWRKSTRTNLDAARQYGSAADDLEQLGRMGILRRVDRTTPDHRAFSNSSALGDSIQCLPTTEEAIPNIDRIDEAVAAAQEFRNERLKLEQLTSNVNEDPVLVESDYMTMRPIKRRSQLHDSCESQRRPLLEATSDSDASGTAHTDTAFVYPPKPPKHGPPPPLYDNPASESTAAAAQQR